MSIETESLKIFNHSILILWNETKGKWVAECLALNLQVEGETYMLLSQNLIKALSACEENLLMRADETKHSIE